MKTFSVSVDITMAKNICVEAENEEQAKSEVHKIMNKNPYDYICDFSHYLGYEIIDVNEED